MAGTAGHGDTIGIGRCRGRAEGNVHGDARPGEIAGNLVAPVVVPGEFAVGLQHEITFKVIRRQQDVVLVATKITDAGREAGAVFITRAL